jgi:hypothetical protein
LRSVSHRRQQSEADCLPVCVQFNLSVQIEHLALTEMSDYLAQGLPVIACVHTADLSYWSQTVDHVVAVVEVDAQHVSVHDPVLDDGPHLVPRTEFELAQLHYDYLCAIVRK